VTYCDYISADGALVVFSISISSSFKCDGPILKKWQLRPIVGWDRSLPKNVIFDFANIPVILISTLNMNCVKRAIKQIGIYKFDFESPSRVVHS
jgi:hypothetical protein